MEGNKADRAPMRFLIVPASIAAPLLLAGCVNVAAPNKPIEINLNINVTADVVYRLDTQAKTVIQQNSGVF